VTATITRAEALEILVDELESCVDDPVRFAELFLPRFGTPWQKQIDILRSVARFRTTCVYAGNAVGKSWCIAIIVIWFILTHPDAMVIVTGASQQTIGSIAWREIRRALALALLPFGGKVSTAIKASPQVLTVADGWTAMGFATTGCERASGMHAGHLLVIVDESSGVDVEIFEALDSLSPSRVVLFGNPLRADGVFVDRIRQGERDARDGVPPHLATNSIKISSLESPHAQLDRSPVGLADATWLADVARRYTVRSLWYRSHVLAEIPSVSSDVVIDEAHLDWATSRPRVEVPPGHPLRGKVRMGIDLGEGVGKDASAIVVRDDLGILDVVVGNAIGLGEAANHAFRLAAKHGVRHKDITYDMGGIGRDFCNHLARYEITAQPYSGAGEPMDKSQYTNVRSECAWRARQRLDPKHMPDPLSHTLQPHFHIPPQNWWPMMREELKALTYDMVGRQVRLIAKKDLMTRLGRSPDLADAFLMTFFG
jgi:hypothetical protein